MTAKSKTTPEVTAALPNPEDHFDFAMLEVFCTTHESAFGTFLGMERTSTFGRKGSDYYWFKDNGSSILAVAHLDTVVSHKDRGTTLYETKHGAMVRSGALDDRLGAYVLGDLLPRMGLTFDLLFTTGEEDGASTAAHFDPANHHDREYDWIIEFDRGGTDVVMYQYETPELAAAVEACGMDVGDGIFSDISSMDHLGVKAINWGVGYRDYHSTRGHVFLNDLFFMVAGFLIFHSKQADVRWPHEVPVDDYDGVYWFDDSDSDPRHDDACEAVGWGVGDCFGTLHQHRELGTLCQRHYHWADN